jgi:hypothetical protein
MRLLKFATRLFLLFVGAVLGSAIASAVAAALMRPRLQDSTQPEDDEIDVAAVFGSRVFRSSADAFAGGRVICWYSGVDVDLRGAALDPAGAELEVWTAFGGTRIRVPEDWDVESHGIAVFGGAGNSAARPAPESASPRLVVRHRTFFGGFAVAAEPDDETLAV